WVRLMTSTHHVWFIPLLLAVLRGSGKELHLQSYVLSLLLTFSMSVMGRLLAPKTIKLDKGEIYMNINLAYELWKDIKFKFLSVMDNQNFAITVSFSNLV